LRFESKTKRVIRYDRTLLSVIVTLGYTGWIIYSGLFALDHFGSYDSDSAIKTSPNPYLAILVTSCALGATSAFLALRSSPLTYYAYTAFPSWFWGKIIGQVSGIKISSGIQPLKWLPRIAMIATALLSMVVHTTPPFFTFLCAHIFIKVGYTHRSIWSIWFIMMGIIWPLSEIQTSFRKEDRGIWAIWIASCMLSAIFPSLSVEKTESKATV